MQAVYSDPNNYLERKLVNMHSLPENELSHYIHISVTSEMYFESEQPITAQQHQPVLTCKIFSIGDSEKKQLSFGHSRREEAIRLTIYSLDLLSEYWQQNEPIHLNFTTFLTNILQNSHSYEVSSTFQYDPHISMNRIYQSLANLLCFKFNNMKMFSEDILAWESIRSFVKRHNVSMINLGQTPTAQSTVVSTPVFEPSRYVPDFMELKNMLESQRDARILAGPLSPTPIDSHRESWSSETPTATASVNGAKGMETAFVALIERKDQQIRELQDKWATERAALESSLLASTKQLEILVATLKDTIDRDAVQKRDGIVPSEKGSPRRRSIDSQLKIDTSSKSYKNDIVSPTDKYLQEKQLRTVKSAEDTRAAVMKAKKALKARKSGELKSKQQMPQQATTNAAPTHNYVVSLFADKAPTPDGSSSDEVWEDEVELDLTIPQSYVPKTKKRSKHSTSEMIKIVRNIRREYHNNAVEKKDNSSQMEILKELEAFKNVPISPRIAHYSPKLKDRGPPGLAPIEEVDEKSTTPRSYDEKHADLTTNVSKKRRDTEPAITPLSERPNGIVSHDGKLSKGLEKEGNVLIVAAGRRRAHSATRSKTPEPEESPVPENVNSTSISPRRSVDLKELKREVKNEEAFNNAAALSSWRHKRSSNKPEYAESSSDSASSRGGDNANVTIRRMEPVFIRHPSTELFPQDGSLLSPSNTNSDIASMQSPSTKRKIQKKLRFEDQRYEIKLKEDSAPTTPTSQKFNVPIQKMWAFKKLQPKTWFTTDEPRDSLDSDDSSGVETNGARRMRNWWFSKQSSMESVSALIEDEHLKTLRKSFSDPNFGDSPTDTKKRMQPRRERVGGRLLEK